MDFGTVNRITDEIFDAGLDPDGWRQVAIQLSEFFGGSAIVVDSRATLGDDLSVVASSRFDEALRKLHFDEYRTPHDNPAVAALLSAKVGTPFPIESFMSAELYARDPSARAILHPQRLSKVLLVAMERDEHGMTFMNVMRRRDQPDFEPAHAAALSFFAKQITRSLHFSRAQLRVRVQAEVAKSRTNIGSTIDGTMLLDRKYRVVDADAGAIAILDSASGLAILRDKLVSTSNVSGTDTQSLHRFISAASSPPPSRFVHCL